DHCGIGQAIGDPSARSEAVRILRDPAVFRNSANSTNDHLICRRVKIFQTAVAARREGVIFPARAVGQRELPAHLPLIAHIDGKDVAVVFVGFGKQGHFAGIGRKTEKERSKRVEVVSRRTTIKLRRSLRELKTARSEAKTAKRGLLL